jgi:hypothetical protein
VQSKRSLDDFCRRVSVELMRSLLRRILRDGYLPGTRVDVLPARDVRMHAYVVPLGVGLALKERGPSLAGVTLPVSITELSPR